MGKAIILNDLGNGRYQVEVQVDINFTQNVLNRLDAKIAELEATIVDLEAELATLENDLSSTKAINEVEISNLEDAIHTIELQIEPLRSLLTTYHAELSALKKAFPIDQSAIDVKESQIKGVEEDIQEKESQIDDKAKEIEKLQEEIYQAELAVAEKKSEIAFTKAELLSRKKRRENILRLGFIYNYNTVAWCCDLTEGLSGEVPTIEVGTEYPALSSFINIFPAYGGLPPYNPLNHGMLTPYIPLPVSDACRNFCAYPAIQKWAPTFRYGTITSIDYDNNTCNVSLENITSSILSLSINQTATLSDVPIEYMFCDAAAFEEGDSVVIQFMNHDWNQPKVIGFKQEPKPCGWEEPWDGPEITWKYPWVYTYSFGGGTGTQATRTITNGIMTMTFPPTDAGSGSYEQSHYLQYIPENLILTTNIKTIKFDCAAQIQCYSGGACTHDYKVTLVGWDVGQNTLINIIVKVVYNGYWPHIGCIGFDYDETEWEQTESDVGSVFWLPGGPYPYKTYEKLIKNNNQYYIKLPETISIAMAIGVEMDVEWIGGATYLMPSQIEGGSLSCDFIGLA